jgi:hypothetical protein
MDTNTGTSAISEDDQHHSAGNKLKTRENAATSNDDEPLPLEDDWDYEAHNSFVKGVFMEGLKACSPSVLMDQMHNKANYITSER